MMNLFEVLSCDERIIVFSSEEDNCFYTWNQDQTLQCWGRAKRWCDAYHWPDAWEESAVKTLEKKPKSYDEAREAAQNWYFGVD